MKGVLKGFKYISTIFGKLGMLSEKNSRKPTIKYSNEEKEDEIQIGLPTDVKHVAHIGRTDGPSTESPSWMKDFQSARPKSAPLDSEGKSIESSRKKTSTDTDGLPKASRRRHSADSLAFENSEKTISTRSKGPSRRHHKKMNSDGSVSKTSRTRRHHRKESLSDQEGSSSQPSGVTEDLNSNGEVSERPTSPTSRNLPDVPKKTRRKKVKDEMNKAASKAKAKTSGEGAPPPTPPLPPTKTIICDNESCQISFKPSPPTVQEEKSDIAGGLDNSA